MAEGRELLEAKYTSPSEKEFVFLWETASKKTQLKTGIFTFPDKDGAHVQHQGGGPVSFPMDCIFNGDDHIKQADNFEAALLEQDVAELQHPVYGIRKVIPTGDIQRNNDFVTLLNETHVIITFTETITDDEPTKLEAVVADEIESEYDEFSESAAADFAESLNVESITEEIQLISVLDDETNILNDNLSGLVLSGDSISNSVKKKNGFADFLTKINELRSNIKKILNKAEGFVQTALNIARLALHIMKMPSRMVININEKIKGYSQLIAAIVNQFKNDPMGINNIKNSFASTRLVLMGAVASISSGAALSISDSAARGGVSAPSSSGGIAGSSAGGTSATDSSGAPGVASGGGVSGPGAASSGVLTREAAVAIAVQLNELLNTIQVFEDTKVEKNNFIDSNASTYSLLVQLVNKSIQLILSACFALPMRRTIKLDRDRNFIELCAEYYGFVDDYYLNRFIIENNLNIDELEIIQMGREVSYYVEST